MSGHSKWSTIKRKKEAVDTKRGKIFSILSKQITVAVKEGKSGDISQNPRLRLALEKAREENMPKINIQKAIDKGLGKGDGNTVEEILYEGYVSGGVGVLVKVLTDNKNRSASEIKMLFDRAGGSLGSPGSAAYLFERSGDTYSVKIGISVGSSDRDNVLSLVEQLEDHEDVEFVVTNMLESQ